MSEGKATKIQREIPIRGDLFIQPSNPKDSPKLILSRCRECGGVFYPQAEMCPACIREGTLDRIEADGKGRLVAFTKVWRSPPGFDSPYVMASVELDEGPVVISQLHDWQGTDLRINMPVQFVIGRIKQDPEGNVVIGPKFRPATE